jgi:peptidoglycan/xylan/chitin deacetylase (PgdA/CDA1 family)
VAITFDAGLISDLWAAEKLLKFGFSAIFFVVEDFINSNYTDQRHVKALSEMGGI